MPLRSCLMFGDVWSHKWEGVGGVRGVEISLLLFQGVVRHLTSLFSPLTNGTAMILSVFRTAMLLYLFTRTRQILLDLSTRRRVLRAAKCVVHFRRLIQTTPALWSCTTGPCRFPMTTPRGVTAYRCWSTTRSTLPAMSTATGPISVGVYHRKIR